MLANARIWTEGSDLKVQVVALGSCGIGQLTIASPTDCGQNTEYSAWHAESLPNNVNNSGKIWDWSQNLNNNP